MKAIATISSKGQITIPVEVRRQIGLVSRWSFRLRLESQHCAVSSMTLTRLLSGLGV
jgi:hypothetical protein